MSYDLVVRPEIKEAKDLRGKRFGITSIGGTVWMAAYLALEHLGLDANRDQIRINAIGNQTILAQAIESAQIDATLLNPFLRPPDQVQRTAGADRATARQDSLHQHRLGGER